MNTLDTRDLIEEREVAMQTILDAWNEQFEDNQVENFEDIDLTDEDLDTEDFQQQYDDEYTTINEINTLEDEISSSEFDDGLFLVDEDNFEEYCKDFLEDCGYFGNDFPQWIKNNIDWNGITDDMKQDYQEVEFRGTTYLYR
jgi:hypothetical protein